MRNGYLNSLKQVFIIADPIEGLHKSSGISQISLVRCYFGKNVVSIHSIFLKFFYLQLDSEFCSKMLSIIKKTLSLGLKEESECEAGAPLFQRYKIYFGARFAFFTQIISQSPDASQLLGCKKLYKKLKIFNPV